MKKFLFTFSLFTILIMLGIVSIGCGQKWENRQVIDVKLIADKNLSKTIHDFLIDNPKASVADVKQGNSEYKVQYPVYSYSYKKSTVDVYYLSEDGIITSDYIIVTEHWVPPLPPTLPIISPIADPFTDSTYKAKPTDICNWLKHYIKLTKTYHRYMERCLTI